MWDQYVAIFPLDSITILSLLHDSLSLSLLIFIMLALNIISNAQIKRLWLKVRMYAPCLSSNEAAWKCSSKNASIAISLALAYSTSYIYNFVKY